MKPRKNWIGVDFDGTLAVFETPFVVNGIPKPVELMVARVQYWLDEGIDVRIVTARVAESSCKLFSCTVEEAQAPVDDFCQLHFGRRLPVTCEKDFWMVELWDDRAVQVLHNQGKRADGSFDMSDGHVDGTAAMTKANDRRLAALPRQQRRALVRDRGKLGERGLHRKLSQMQYNGHCPMGCDLPPDPEEEG